MIVSRPDLDVLNSFEHWMSDYNNGVRYQEFIEQGIQMAAQRKVILDELIQADARAALSHAIGYSDYSSMPSSLQPHLERPFSMTGNVEVLAACSDHHQSAVYQLTVYDETGDRFRVGPDPEWRTGLSKLNIPLQGIRLGNWVALKPTVLDRVEGKDAAWAVNNLKMANSDEALDFLTGEKIRHEPEVAVAGGHFFLFNSIDDLSDLNVALRRLDNLPGKTTGSSVLFDSHNAKLAKGFPIKSIEDSQLQIAIDETTGEKAILFIRIEFQDKTLKNVDNAQEVFDEEVSQYVSDYSYGQTSATFTVTEKVYMLERGYKEYFALSESDTVGPEELFSEAVAAYRADVKDQDPYLEYDVVGLIFPTVQEYRFLGAATLGGANSRIFLNGNNSAQVTLHEVGHTLGLVHANYWNHRRTNLESTNPVDPTGGNDEYGDVYDIMGGGKPETAHFHPGAKRYLGWLTEDQVPRIDDAAKSGVYRIYNFDQKDTPASELQGLEIKKSDTENYWVGFRSSIEDTEPNAGGAYIVWEREEGAERNQGWILDTKPEDMNIFAILPIGHVYSDDAAGIQIIPLEIGGTDPAKYLEVAVQYEEVDGNHPPLLSLSVPAEGFARSPVTFNADAQDVDGDELEFLWNVQDGFQYHRGPTATVTFDSAGTYDVTVTVIDFNGGFETQSVAISISDPYDEWRILNSNAEGDLLAMAHNEQFVVAAGEKSFLRSIDGISWTDHTPSHIENFAIRDLCWTGYEFVAVGHGFDPLDPLETQAQFPLILTSSDGSDWSVEFELPNNFFNGNRLNSVASSDNGEVVIAVGAYGQVFKRIGGGSWESVDLGLSDESQITGVAYGNGHFVVGGYFDKTATTFDHRILFRTQDGNDWVSLAENDDVFSQVDIQHVGFENGLFFLMSSAERYQFTYYSENNGEIWNRADQGGNYQIERITYGNGLYNSIGFAFERSDEWAINKISQDGITWNLIGNGIGAIGNDIAFFNDGFLVVGDAGQIWRSERLLFGFEAWAAQFFESDDRIASGNPDGDWANNVMEWALGSSPVEFGSVPSVPEFAIDLNGKAIFSIHRFSITEDVVLMLEKSRDLINWQTLPTTVVVDEERLLTLRSAETIDDQRCFFRIRASVR